MPKRKYYEVRPGFDMLRYLVNYSYVTMLSKKVSKRPHRFFIEVTSNIDRHILTEGLFEKGVIDLLSDLIKESGQTELMIDIGANVGNHTVSLAEHFEAVHSVEPHPVLFRILEANAIKNRLGHVRCHNFGLAGEDTSGTLTETVDNHSISRIKERSKLPPEVFGLTTDSFGEEFSVELKSAFDFVGQFENQLKSCFIKIDVEGMEEEILTAISPLLAKHHPLVGFEWFTKSQPKMAEVVTSIPGYRLWGIRMHDMGSNFALRALKLLFTGRSYTLEPIDVNNLDEVYPLALLIPDKLSERLG